MGRLLIGTSGYVYADWRGAVYPPKLPVRRWLELYSRLFPIVELNNTFYRLPPEGASDAWRAQTPDDFIFVAKGSRYLTHMKRLLDYTRGLDRFFGRVQGLREKLRVVLWQLPPQMKKPDPERLDTFLRHLPGQYRHAFEFRDAGWYTDEICAVLDAHGAAFVEHDLVPRAPPRFTGNFRYVRFHGATARYHGRYGAERLAQSADDYRKWKRRGDVLVFFNNDHQAHAVHDALDLRRLCFGATVEQVLALHA